MNSGCSNMHETSVLTNEIKVMVIDHKQDYLASVRDFLECNSFEVTCVHQAGVALSMLTTTKDKFDLLLIASDMTEVDVITFLRYIKNMDILSMVMCQRTDDNFLLKVLHNGGFRVVNMPLTYDVVTHIRQDVIRARFHKFEQFKMFDETGRRRDGNARRLKIKKRVRVEWTEEIHSRFIKAVHELGEGKCFPKNILDAMGVPGLTRLQVASHLQKCRREVSKVLQRKGTPSSSSNNLCQEDDLRMFGNIPSFVTHVANQVQIGTNIDGTYPFNGGKSDGNNQTMNGTYSAMNGFSYRNHTEVYSAPSYYNHNSFPPNQVSCNQVMPPAQGTSEFNQII